MNVDAMIIKVARMYPYDNGKHLKAFVDIVINNCLLIKGIKVIDGKEGLFVSMPREQSKDNRWFDSVRCLNRDLKELINQEVLAAYNDLLEKERTFLN